MRFAFGEGHIRPQDFWLMSFVEWRCLLTAGQQGQSERIPINRHKELMDYGARLNS